MQTISVPQIGKIAPTEKGRKLPIASNGGRSWRRNEEILGTLSEREKETLWNMSLKHPADLRDMLAGRDATEVSSILVITEEV